MNRWKIFALAAALCYASAGVISKSIFAFSISPIQIAFYKCLITFTLLTCMIIFKKRAMAEIWALGKQSWKIALCALFGLFTLLYFETSAYLYTTISVTVFVLIGSSLVVTFSLSRFVLKEKMTIHQLLGFVIALFGLFFLLCENGSRFISYGGFLAMVAGAGYGLFLVLTKKFDITKIGVSFLWWFFGFGTLLLSVPFMLNNPVVLPLASLPWLVALSIISGLGGFYFTIKALSLTQANKVQLFELSEPVFASIFAFLIFAEFMDAIQFLGAGLIIFAIYYSERNRINPA